MVNKRNTRRYFDPTPFIRCWVDLDQPEASFHCDDKRLSEQRLVGYVSAYSQSLRQRAEIAERWLFVRRYHPEGGEQ